MNLYTLSNDFDLTLDDLILEVEEDGHFLRYAADMRTTADIRSEITSEASSQTPSYAKLLALVVLGSYRSA